MSGLWAAVGFLTRLPVGGRLAPGRGVPWFPVVGAGVGAVSGLTYWTVASVTPSLVAATLACAVAVAITGAFHEDGLADTFDGLSSIRSVERQLEIMRDSRLGTFGVSALVLVLIARVAAVGALEAGVSAVALFAWLHALAAGVVLVVMVVSRPAADDGAGADYLTGLRPFGPLVVAIATTLLGWLVVGPDLWIVAAGAVVGPALMTAWAYRRIGGVTGDVLGACQQLALLGGLVIVAG